MWPDTIVADTSTLFFLYVLFGAIGYSQLEGWNVEETLYFVVVATTTVGYGDLVPLTSAGRILTCMYIPIGIVIVYRMMFPYAVLFMKSVDSLAVGIIPGLADHPESVAVEGDPNHGRQAARALLSPLVLLVLAASLLHRFLEYTLVDAVYFSLTSMATIGFGDLAPMTLKGKGMAAVLMLLGSATFAGVVERFYRIAQGRSMRDTPHSKLTEDLLLHPSCWDTRLDGSSLYAARADAEGLSEAEFLLSVLVAHEVVDIGTLTALRRQFAHIIRAGGSGGGGDGGGASGVSGGEGARARVRLDARLIFDTCVKEGRIRQRPADAALGTALPAPETPIRTELSSDTFPTVDLEAEVCEGDENASILVMMMMMIMMTEADDEHAYASILALWLPPGCPTFLPFRHGCLRAGRRLRGVARAFLEGPRGKCARRQSHPHLHRQRHAPPAGWRQRATSSRCTRRSRDRQRCRCTHIVGVTGAGARCGATVVSAPPVSQGTLIRTRGLRGARVCGATVPRAVSESKIDRKNAPTVGSA